jgi:hypothetical protein
MSRLISRAENWETVYRSFGSINFAAFDYNTIKTSLIDYIKISFPERFNDFIESSELIAIIESFAYVGELLAYRIDVSSRENFISTATRHDSILRLAKLISYKANRPTPHAGLVKITSVSTNEPLSDAFGNNLTGKIVHWNDKSNALWQHQFEAIVSAITNEVNTTTNSVSLQDIRYTLYSVDSNNTNVPVSAFTTTVGSTPIRLEIIPIEVDPVFGFTEKRPEMSNNLSLLFSTDGLGNDSSGTGYMVYVKQGQLSKTRKWFDGVTTNQLVDISTNNINDTDVWVNQVNPDTGEVLDIQTTSRNKGKSGYWYEVNTNHSYNIAFNNITDTRNKFEVETKPNNQVRLIFGDNTYSNVPSGWFDIWTRSSINQTITIPPAALSNVSVSIPYTSNGRSYIATIVLTAATALTNGSAAETMEHVRATAPSVYYTQDRMVNGIDYNKYPLQESSILKLRAVNRTFVGDSQYNYWHDPSNTFEHVKLFNDDGVLYYDVYTDVTTIADVSVSTIMNKTIPDMIVSHDIRNTLLRYGIENPLVQLPSATVNSINTYLTTNPTYPGAVVSLFYKITTNEWLVWPDEVPPTISQVSDIHLSYIPFPILTIAQSPTANISVGSYTITKRVELLTTYSKSTEMWSDNDANTVLDFTTLTTHVDKIRILQSNINCNRDKILSSDWIFNTFKRVTIPVGSELGLNDPHRLVVLPSDVNQDAVPDFSNPNDFNNGSPSGIANILSAKQEVDLTSVIIPNAGRLVQVPIPYITGTNSVHVQFVNGVAATRGIHWLEVTNTPRRLLFDYNGVLTGVTSTGFANDSTVYDCTLLLNQTALVVPIIGSTAQTIDALIAGIAILIAPYASIALVAGDIAITSSILTVQSEVSVLQLGFFGTLPGFRFVNEVDVHVISDKILLTEIGGYNGINNCTYPNQYWELIYSDPSYVDTLECVHVVSSLSANAGFNGEIVRIIVDDFVYLDRPDITSNWNISTSSSAAMISYINELIVPTQLVDRRIGKGGLNFAWYHTAPRHHLINPSATNIIDMAIIQHSYYNDVVHWVDSGAIQPIAPTAYSLTQSYNYLLANKMISDSAVLYSGNIKILFGPKADPHLRAKVVIVKAPHTPLTNSQLTQQISKDIRTFFSPDLWELGESFSFSELAAWVHDSHAGDISSIILIPLSDIGSKGEMQQILAMEDEIFYPDLSGNTIEIVESYADVIGLYPITGACIPRVYNIIPPPLVNECEYIDPYADVDYCDTQYLTSLNCQ